MTRCLFAVLIYFHAAANMSQFSADRSNIGVLSMSESAWAKVVDAFDKYKLLLLADDAFPNVVQLVANEKVSGSWWGHPKGRAIFGICERLEDRDDALIVKLISKKVTFVQRALWTSVASLGEAKLDWQLAKLPQSCEDLLNRVEETETFYVVASDSERKHAKQLETRLLCVSRDEHTPSGAHRKILISWPSWRRETKFKDVKDIESAKSELERLVRDLNSQFQASGKLPWT